MQKVLGTNSSKYLKDIRTGSFLYGFNDGFFAIGNIFGGLDINEIKVHPITVSEAWLSTGAAITSAVSWYGEECVESKVRKREWGCSIPAE